MNLHYSSRKIDHLLDKICYEDLKPNGLWYSIDEAWLEWCISERFRYIPRAVVNVYEVVMPKDVNILRLANLAQVVTFNTMYIGNNGYSVNWKRLQHEYDGIEINPYRHTFDTTVPIWYYAWDVPSGCIWRTKDVELVELEPVTIEEDYSDVEV